MITHIANILSFNAPDAFWIWLFPVTYLIHMTEEYGGGFSAHLSKTRGFSLTSLRFFSISAAGLVLMIVGIVLAERFKFPQLLLVIYGAAVFTNGLSHAASGAMKGEYNPGLVTGVLLWVPQGALTLARLTGTMSGGRLLTGIVIGIGVQLSATLLSLSGGRVSETRGAERSAESVRATRDTTLLLLILCLNCYMLIKYSGWLRG